MIVTSTIKADAIAILHRKYILYIRLARADISPSLWRTGGFACVALSKIEVMGRALV